MRKVPVADQSKCRKCNACVDACYLHAVSVITNTCCAKCIKYCISIPVPCHPEYVVFDYDICDSCGKCVERCPHCAIYLTDIETAVLKKMASI